MDRITAIRTSLRSFGCGLVGVLPVVGFLPALYALFSWYRVRRRFGREWNPAAGYLHWGALFALFGLMLTGLVFAALAIAIWG